MENQKFRAGGVFTVQAKPLEVKRKPTTAQRATAAATCKK